MTNNEKQTPLIYLTLFVFMILFAFMIFPGETDPYYATPKIVYLISFTLILWSVFLLHWFKNKQFPLRNIRRSEIYLFVYLLVIVLSTIFSKDVIQSIFGMWHRFEGVFAFFSYGSLFFFTSRFIYAIHYQALLKGTLISSVLVSIYGILQHFFLDFLPRNSEKVLWTRSYAFFDNPNFFGSYLVLMTTLTMAFYLKSNNKKELLFYGAISCIHFAALIYTITRGAWLGLFIPCLMISIGIVWRLRVLFKRWAVLVAVLVCIFTLINVTENNRYIGRAGTIIDEVGGIFSGEESNDAGSGRWYIWRKSLPLIKDYYLIGSGPSTFALVFPQTDENEVFTDDELTGEAHNEYLQIAVTMGIPALIAYLLLVGHILKSGWQARHKLKGGFQILNYGLLAAIIGYLVQAFFNVSVITVAPYFWIFLGLSYGLSSHVHEAHETA